MNGHVGVDGTDGNKGKDGMDRVVYEDHNHVTHEVATLDDGLKFIGDDSTHTFPHQPQLRTCHNSAP